MDDQVLEETKTLPITTSKEIPVEPSSKITPPETKPTLQDSLKEVNPPVQEDITKKDIPKGTTKTKTEDAPPHDENTSSRTKKRSFCINYLNDKCDGKCGLSHLNFCIFYSFFGRCKYKSCANLHLKICNYKSKDCKYGKKCKFLHVNETNVLNAIHKNST